MKQKALVFCKAHFFFVGGMQANNLLQHELSAREPRFLSLACFILSKILVFTVQDLCEYIEVEMPIG